jgi:hypothetical protein
VTMRPRRSMGRRCGASFCRPRWVRAALSGVKSEEDRQLVAQFSRLLREALREDQERAGTCD